MKSSTNRALVAKKQSTSFAQVATNLLNVLQGCSKSIRLLLVMFLTLIVTTNAWGATYTKATSISAGDVVLLVCEREGKELSGISTTSTKYGLGRDYTTTPAGAYELTVCDGSGDDTYAFKNSSNQYLYWGSGNSLNVNATLNSNTSWSVSFDGSGNATIENSNTAGRIIMWNHNSPRFATYSRQSFGDTYYYVQIYKKADYTVTATSNNNNYGTVSVSGTTITASPKTGYTYANPAYTVTSGTAIVTQNGNTFTVSPSTNCTVRINFEAKPKYTVTLEAGPGTCAASVTEASAGAGVTLPTPTLDGCGDWEFAGWKTTSAVTTETTTEPTLIPAGAYSPTSNITLYAVYQRTEGGSGFKLSLNSSGTEYYIGPKGSGNYMSAVTDAASAVIFTFADGYLSYDNSGAKTYISSGGDNTTLTVGTNVPTSTWTETGTTTYSYQSSASGNRYLGFNKDASPNRFAPYVSTYPHAFTKHSASTTYYISVPDCGAPCTDAVTISKGSETNGTFTLSTTGQQSTCNGPVIVTLSDIEPATGYQFSEITQSGVDAAKVTIDNTAKTVTYAQNTSGTSTINVTFIEIPKHTVTLNPNYPNGKTGTFTYDAGELVDGNLVFTYDYNTASKTLADLYTSLTLDGYEFGGWYNAKGANPGEVSGSKCTTTGTITGNKTYYAKWTPVYTVIWLANGQEFHTQTAVEGTALDLPDSEPDAAMFACNDKVFVGWTATQIDGSTDTEPVDLFTTKNINVEAAATTYYAVFATKSTGSGSAELVKMTAYDDFNIGDKIVIIAEGTQYGLYQKTSTSNYIDYWTTQDIDGVPTLAEIENDSKRYVEVSAGTATGTIKLGDATNGYLYNSSSTNMSISTNNSSDWSIIAWTDNTFTFEARQYLSCRTDLSNTNTNKWRGAGSSCNCETGNGCSGVIYYNVYKYTSGSSTTYSGYVTTCCTQPKTPLTITADQIELVKSGVVTLTATGGNGTDITWTATGGVLSNQSNTGATLTISDVDATQNITVTATQAENNNDDEVVYCAQEASIDITVKAQWTITFQTNDNGVKNSNSILVTDGESYTMPDISDEYVCNSGSSFAGWVDNEDDTEVDATPDSTQTATADQTWYAAWSLSSNTKSVDIYQLVTNVANLAAGDEVWITNTTPTVAMGVQNDNNRGQVTVTKHPTESDKIYSTGSPATLTIGKDGTNYTFHDGTGYLYAASSSKNYLRLQATNNDNGKWSITIEDGKATITAQGTNTRNKLKYNSSSSIFSCYESGQGDVRIYKNVGTEEIEVSGASITTNNTSCHRGAVIFAENGKWITSSKGQKVRIAINVTARGFESDATLSATSANEHFSVVSITNTTITKNSAFETQMMIEYQPAEANTNENAEITLVAKKGEEVVATRTIDVNGRSLPDEFVIVAQYNDKWLAVPANMQSGADQYNGIEVMPNNELTQIPAAPSTTIYSLRGVADNRYEAAGTCVRLVGNGNKCLWGNAASTNTTIQNWTTLASTNGSNYEWLLTTSDGELYTIANPAHPDYNQGRILSNSGSKYGLYKGTTKFYILPVGCSSLPGNIQVTARRVDATFSWETNASTVTIDLYTNEGMTEGHKTASVTDVPYLFSSLAENTQYWYKLTPDADDDCAVTGTFKTTGPVIDVVEWGENSATIYVDKDEAVDPRIIIAGEVEHGQGGIVATDIFFSKYFEAEGTAKLLAIYNGTANAISLADITILQRTSAKNTPLSLASYGKTAGWIQPGEEIVLFNRDSRDAVMDCAENNETYDSWINVEDNNLSFSGKGTIRLFRGNTCIDIIGAMNAGDNAANMNDKTRDPMEGAASPSFGDAKGFVTLFGDNYETPAEETDYELSTNRCLLIRRAFVTSGDSALLNNFGDFKTLGTYTGVDSKTHKGEWSGLQIPTAVPPETDYIHTCAGFEDAGSFDYNKYYKEFSTISDDKYLSDFARADDGTYTLSIEYMRQYACMNLKFQLTAHNDPTDVLTEQLVQVPIVVKDARNSNDTLFNNIIKQDVEPHAPMVPESINRCKTCNVVVLGTGTLTKVADGSTNDVAEIRDVKVYPGGKLIIPEGTHYVVNSLALRRQEDVVAAAKINSGLADDPDDITDKGIYIRESNGVYLDVRIDPSKWHYFTLPYDCRVGDVRFADGTPAKVNTDYLISWYDGAYRAEHKTGGWTDITSDDYVLKAGLGYIVALPGSGLIKRELRFPMANNVIAEELGDKTVGGLYAYGGDKTDEELRPNHKGWNMIGNPYLYDYTTDIVTDPLAVGELEHDPSGSSWNGKWVRTGSARYIVAPIDDNGWKGYEQTTISNLRPFMSYFIQVGTKTDGTENPETERSITFDKDQKPASIIRRAQAEDAEPMYPVWYGLELLAPNGEKDNTTLLISNEFTDDYDMMDDLIKMRGSYYNYYQNPVLASRNNSGEMAFNALPDSSAAVIGVPLNYYAYQAGTYTFATDSRYDLEEVKSAMLFDATTQQYYDLLTENHSFSLAKGDNNARFKLYVRVERKKPQITTDVDNLLVDGQLSLIALDKTLVLSGLTDAADIYVYDATGKLIRSDLSASGGGIWRTNVPAQGVYFVRVNSTTSQQTLRTVVK